MGMKTKWMDKEYNMSKIEVIRRLIRENAQRRDINRESEPLDSQAWGPRLAKALRTLREIGSGIK